MKSKIFNIAISLLAINGGMTLHGESAPTLPTHIAATSLENQIIDERLLLEVLTHSHPAVLKAYDDFVSSLQASKVLSATQKITILKAIGFAAEKHQFQKRKDPEQTPYIIHPIGVAHQIMTLGKVEDPAILIGALLHDTVEDTKTSFEEIRSAFGEKIEAYVKEVTDNKALPKEERKRLQIINASHKSEGAALIKLSDKLYNLTSFATNPPADWSASRIDQYFMWAQYVTEGLPKVNQPLKDAVKKAIDDHFKTTEAADVSQ